MLIKEVPKLVHGLVYFDVYPDDRQNFKSMTKCMDDRVQKALRDFVPGSEATAFYLKLCAELATSSMGHDIIPHQRIEKMFHVLYFLRIWRKWIISSGYSLINFITSNAYMCIEVNAANLLNLVRRLRDEGRPELFLTTLFDSQANERTFRQFRAMGTQNFTKVNFNIYEILHMTRRHEVQSDIIYNKLPSNVKLPKLEKCRETTKIYSLPSEVEIQECLKRAKRLALDDAAIFSIQIESNEIAECELNIPKKLVIEEQANDSEQEEISELFDEVVVESDFPDEDGFEFNVDEETLPHGYVKIRDPKNPNKEISIRKSTFVWHLTEGTKKISSDRLIRVQNMSFAYASESSKHDSTSVLNSINVFQNLRVGDWCFFKYNTDDNKICVGQILAFKFVMAKTAKERRYHADFVDLKEYKEQIPHGKKVAALSSWYFINSHSHLIPVKRENHYFIEISNYVATCVKPNMDPDTNVLFFSENDFKKIECNILMILNNEKN